MKADVAVIGGGPGGYVAAIRAARLGLRTVLFEKERLGGVCLNKGCIPTKTLLHMAQLYWDMSHAAEWGITTGERGVDFSKMQARKNAVVRQLSGGVAALLKNSGVQVVAEKAALTSPHRVEAAGESWEAENVILAMGAEPVMPKAAAGSGLSSDAFLELEKLPQAVVIVGGGVIGVEFAELLAKLGVQATILEEQERLLSTADEDVSQLITVGLERKGVRVICGASVTECRPNEVAFRKNGKSGQLAAERTLISVGRRPNLAAENLERLGIHLENGKVKVNPYMQTSQSHIYAIGDLVAGPMLAHKASAEGIVAAERIAGGSRPMRYDRIPQCVYTTPEAAWVGMPLSEAERRGDVDICAFPISHNGKSLAQGETEGFVRLIAHRETREILGAQMVCSHASELIGQVLAAMQAEACVEDLAELISPHPSVCESVMEAAAGLCGKGIHILEA